MQSSWLLGSMILNWSKKKKKKNQKFCTQNNIHCDMLSQNLGINYFWLSDKAL